MVEQVTQSGSRENMFGYLSVLLASAMFGSVFTVAKVPLSSIDPLVLAALTYTISGLSLIPFVRGSFRFQSRRDYTYLACVTILGGIAGPLLLLFGLQNASASDGSILSNGEVVFTIALSALFFGEKPKGAHALAGVAMVAVGLFITTTDLKISQTALMPKAGNLMILAAMLMWALDNNISRKFTLSPGASPAKIAMTKSLLGGLTILAAAFAMHHSSDFAKISPTLWSIVIAMSITGFGGALLLFLEGIKRIGTVKTMSVFSLTAVFGIATAAIAGGEPITMVQVLATGVIIAGIVLVGRR